jgi:hypothetical protein
MKIGSLGKDASFNKCHATVRLIYKIFRRTLQYCLYFDKQFSPHYFSRYKRKYTFICLFINWFSETLG